MIPGQFVRLLLTVIAASLAFPYLIQAASIVVDFHDMPDNSSPYLFYAGGNTSAGNGPGPNLGVSFPQGADRILVGDASSFSNQTNLPFTRVLYTPYSAPFTVDVAQGFTDGFSLYYINDPVYQDASNVFYVRDANGNILTTGNLSSSDNAFRATGVSFSGVATSVEIYPYARSLIYGDFTFGSSTPGGNSLAPEPATAAMLLLAGAGAFGIMRQRRMYKR